MSFQTSGARRRKSRRRLALAVLTGSALAVAAPAAMADGPHLRTPPPLNGAQIVPGSLLISGSTYAGANVTVGQTLPVGCVATTNFGGVSCATAAYGGSYPTVFNNAPIDASFGVTSPIFLDDVNAAGETLHQLNIPTDEMVTSFSSKSELGLNFSTNGTALSFMGYQAPVAALDVSNSNTPGVVDPSNPVPQSYYREAAELTAGGISYTESNAYSGNNGRAAILDNNNNEFYAAGNAGNGNNPEPDGVILGAGAQIFTPNAPAPNPPTPFGSFNQTETGQKADKTGKDTNFRGLTISNNVVYLTKGSGGNGIDTVYFVDTTGNACPSGGVGVPQPGAPLPTAINYDASELQNLGVVESGTDKYNMCILAGFPTISQKAASPPANAPFGIWFANPTTLYVADEGNGSTTYDASSNTWPGVAGDMLAGLEKWTFNADTQSWQMDYALQNGLNIGQPYTVPGYPTGDNPATMLPWAPTTAGLRNITGQVNRNGTVTIYAVTSTVSGGGDQGADPNKVVGITDELRSTTGAGERFSTVKTSSAGQVLRGVAIVPAAFR
jgi:hypothetical protein